MNDGARPTKPLVVAQFSDCHLFSDINGLHHGSNVFQHLQQVLADIAKNKQLDAIIFTGDLSQDHSEQSYQNFVEAVQQVTLKTPVYFLSGNHDEKALLTKYLTEPLFCEEKTVNAKYWQIHLLNSKSDSPAGYISKKQLSKVKTNICHEKFQLLMMHHHPVDMGFFIDRHGLINQADFWQCIDGMLQAQINIKGIACGHVHQANFIPRKTSNNLQSVDIYTCPATSIAFDPTKETVSSLNLGPSYRLFYLHTDGAIQSEVKYL
jgi:Icc protein